MSDEQTHGRWQVDPETMIALRLSRAAETLEAGDAEGALVEVEELLEDHPDNLDALFLTGEAALALRDAGMAREAFEHYLSLSADHPQALEGLCVARFESVDFAGALEAARGANRVEPDRARAWYYEGLVLERAGDSRAATRAFEAANALAPDTYPLPRSFSEAAWEEALVRGRRMLPGPIRAFYAQIPIKWENFPAVPDLTAVSPALSPFSYALYEGVPPEGGDPWTEVPRAIRLFRGNLRHGVRRSEDLARRIADALMHEAAAWLDMNESDLL